MLDSSKDPMDPKMQKGVHTTSCSCGETYIKETRHSNQVRLKEHCAEIVYNHPKKISLSQACP
jgi:hypothetical protein